MTILYLLQVLMILFMVIIMIVLLNGLQLWQNMLDLVNHDKSGLINDKKQKETKDKEKDVYAWINFVLESRKSFESVYEKEF